MRSGELHPGAIPQFTCLSQAAELFEPMDWSALPFTPAPILRVVEHWLITLDRDAVEEAWKLARIGSALYREGWLEPASKTFFTILSILKRRFGVPVESLFTAAHFVVRYREIAP